MLLAKRWKQHSTWPKMILWIGLFLLAQPCIGQNKPINPTNTDKLKQAEVLLNSNFLEAYNQAVQLRDEANRNKDYSLLISSTCIISNILCKTNKCNEAIKELDKAWTFAHQHKNNLDKARIFSAKGICMYNLALFDSSKKFHEEALKIFEKTNASSEKYSELNNLARASLQNGESKNASAYNALARVGFEKLNDKDGISFSEDILGEILQAQRLYDKSEIAHKNSFQEFNKRGNINGKGIAALHLGNSFYMQIMDDSAMHYYNIALEKYKMLGDSTGIANAYSNLSRVLLEKGDHTLAIYYAKQCLAGIKGGGYKRIETATLQHLGDIYAGMGNDAKAIQVVEQALEIAKGIDHKASMMDCYKSLSEMYASINNPQKSYSYLLEAFRLKDKLQPLAFSEQLAEMQDKHEKENTETELKNLQTLDKIKSLEILEKDFKINNRNSILAILLILSVMIGILVYYYFKQQKLKSTHEKQLAIQITQEDERLRFAKDIHDDLGSELSKINFLSEMIATNNMDAIEVKKTAGNISQSSRNLVDNMRDLIWALNPDNANLSNLVSRIREFASDYLEDYPAELTLNFPDIVADTDISKESQRDILLTVKESLNNIVKHAQASNINIELKTDDDIFQIIIKDNGKGISDLGTNSGNGLRNMTHRIDSTGGNFNIQSGENNGTLISISVPIKNLQKNRLLHM